MKQMNLSLDIPPREDRITTGFSMTISTRERLEKLAAHYRTNNSVVVSYLINTAYDHLQKDSTNAK